MTIDRNEAFSERAADIEITDAPVSSWYGVTVDGDGHVIYLHLSGAGLKGALPEELGDMTFLQELWLSGNEISGVLPSTIGKLPDCRSDKHGAEGRLHPGMIP